MKLIDHAWLACSRAFIREVDGDDLLEVPSPTYLLECVYDEHEGVHASICNGRHAHHALLHSSQLQMQAMLEMTCTAVAIAKSADRVCSHRSHAITTMW